MKSLERQSTDWLQREHAAEPGRNLLAVIGQEKARCKPASIPNSSDPEGTCLYWCTPQLITPQAGFHEPVSVHGLRGIAPGASCPWRSGQSMPSSCRGNAGHQEPGGPTQAETT